MEIHINGQPVAKVTGMSRSVAVQVDGGEITNFDTAPAVRIINLVVEQSLPANAPRLDEIELLRYIEAQEDGLLDGDGESDGIDSIGIEAITESEFKSTDEDGKTEAEKSEEERLENEENENPDSEEQAESQTAENQSEEVNKGNSPFSVGAPS